MNYQTFCAFFLAALWASVSSAQTYCPKPQTTHMLDCVKLSMSTSEQRVCIGYAAEDMDEIERWLQCEVESLDKRQAEERKTLLERAARRREAINSSIMLLTR